MKVKKILAVIVVLYLAIALIMQFQNTEAIEECRSVCSAEGFDIILSATATSTGTSCRCLDSYTREEKIVEI